MKKHLIKILIGLFLAFTAGLITSCASLSPAQRYAREHSDREFTSFKDLNKRLNKATKRKIKDHSKVKHTW